MNAEFLRVKSSKFAAFIRMQIHDMAMSKEIECTLYILNAILLILAEPIHVSTKKHAFVLNTEHPTKLATIILFYFDYLLMASQFSTFQNTFILSNIIFCCTNSGLPKRCRAESRKLKLMYYMWLTEKLSLEKSNDSINVQIE